MAQSTEYPDLKWMPPKSWTNANRTSVQLVVIHTTEGSRHGQSAEDGAAYNQTRDDGTSTHYFHDSNSTVHCVLTADQAHTARAQGNKRGIHHELCTQCGSANWDDDYHQAMLRLAAKQAARDSSKWGIPVRHLTVNEVDDGVKGFCGHWDITRAFPEDGGTHTDPGENFPWSQFLDMVRDELDGDDMELNDSLFEGAPSSSWTNRYGTNDATVRNAMAYAAYDSHDSEKVGNAVKSSVAELSTKVDAQAALLAEMSAKLDQIIAAES